MSKDNLDKVAAASAKAEAHTDAWLTKLVNFPYSWIVFVAYSVFLFVAGYAARG